MACTRQGAEVRSLRDRSLRRALQVKPSVSQTVEGNSNVMSRNRKNNRRGSPGAIVSNPITLPFTVGSATQVLAWGAIPSGAPATHQAIADWCDRFCQRYRDIDAPSEIERILPVLNDVDCQWDLFLASTFSLQRLQEMDFSAVNLPNEWFSEWLHSLTTESPSQAG
jgi:hypothetical protein